MFAIANFGSKIRNISDEYSDNDLLIVCNDEEREGLYKYYSNMGYSVSLFSKRQLYFMRKRGSLFLQHIKRDAEIFFDKDGFFEDFINGCELKAPEIDEIMRCESTISFIASLPDDEKINGWKSDFLYCTSRDYLIKKLALENDLAFGIDEIISKLKLKFKLKEIETDQLKCLRREKSIYRKSIFGFSSYCSHDVISEWVNILHDRFEIEKPKNNLGLLSSISNREICSSYEGLRCLEAVYLLARHRGIYHVMDEKIMRIIQSPNLYRSLQRNKNGIIKKLIFEIINMLQLEDSIRS
ncbi:hypothetical protein [Serratia sp. D1N4]